MDTSAYRLLYDYTHDFKTTAVHVESEIRRHGIRSDSWEELAGMKGRAHHDMWVSMKTVSHFNLGISLESMLKLLLFLNRVEIPRHHMLAELHDAIPDKFQKELEATYQDSNTVLPQGYELVAFLNAEAPKAPTSPPRRDISSLREFLEYFDEDVMLWQKRYSWELVDKGFWRHYLSDIPVFVELIERVMRNIPRY